MKTTVVNTGSNGRCDECRNLRHLYRKPLKGSRRLCATCISRGALRRAELDRELKSMGAHVIRVGDLGAALEANWLGTFPGKQCATFPAVSWPRPEDNEAFLAWFHGRAAHLARVALGESS